MAFYNRCVNCTITFDNPRIVSRRMLALDLPLRDLLLAWISLKEVISADHRVCEECVILLQSQAQVNAPVRDYGHKVVCLGCGVSVLRARSIGIDRSRQEYSIIQSWVPQIQPDLPIFSRVCRPCWRRATRAAALNLENIEQEVEHSLPDVNIQMLTEVDDGNPSTDNDDDDDPSNDDENCLLARDFKLHRFPKDENLKNAWLIKMNKKNWQPKSSSVLCSKHFESHLMDHSGFRTVLTSSAIPTIFDSSFQENISTPSLKDSVKRKAAIGQGAIGLMDLPNSQPSTSSVIPHYNIPASLQPIQPSSSKSVSEDNVLRVTELNKLKTKNLLKNKKIKAAKQQNRRLKAKVAKFTDIISTLKNKLNHDEVHISSGMQGGALEEIIIKEELSDEDRNQCRLCLSVGRRMQELGEYAPLYRKLLFENNFQNTTIPSFMYQMLACWECHAELRRVKRFQDKVRRANAAFETNQNQKSENMSNLSTIIIGEYNNSGAGNIGRVSGLEACVQDIKEEAIETEVEETSVPDPLAVGQEVGKTEEVVVQIEPEPSITQKVAKRTNPQPKPTHSEPKRARTEQHDPKTSQDQENNPKLTPDADSAIFAKVKIEIDELEKILAERRNKESFKAMKFKCDSCILGFTDQYRLRDHNKNFHDEDVGSCECEICERRFDDESQMQAHFRNHFVKFVCKLCQFECYTKTGRTVHQKRHAGSAQGSSLLEQRLTSKQQAATSRSSLEPST